MMTAGIQVAGKWASSFGIAGVFLAIATLSKAETPPPRVYDGVDAAWDAYERAEARRRQSLGMQLEANDAMAWRAGAPTSVPYPPDMETIYGYGVPWAWRSGLWRSPVRAYRDPGVFEPWPFVPGDIYGYPYVDRVEQPRGHVVIPYGPNGYYYGPVYDRDLARQPAPRLVPGASAAPPAAVELPAVPPPAEAPPQAAGPVPEPIPAPPAESGPREF